MFRSLVTFSAAAVAKASTSQVANRVVLRAFASAAASYNTITAEKKGRVGFVQLNRPKALNALNTELCNE
eukprot:CAMPEP_0113908100 /NCGR_PEP_ID=MMETSP0780_2-20120614/25933_1 /TAXON_ID=652834 /ORGANISM="Palpitomonas bilix" /LENGTH=69 /DNA_ID=CAMNT_0000903409 /DNA_START=26 /DNA_END=232 /DNA_ORIENTATION=+ /assembly_acc=CAM_ASM_000599